jgi:hypothetical protein
MSHPPGAAAVNTTQRSVVGRPAGGRDWRSPELKEQSTAEASSGHPSTLMRRPKATTRNRGALDQDKGRARMSATQANREERVEGPLADIP